MWFTPHVLSVITTHQCTAACEHCCFSCSPTVQKAIPIPRLYSLMDEVAEIPTIKLVVFTGGECFLLGRDLDNLIGKCTQNRILTRCVTNGYWATSPRVAQRRAAELQAVGLKEINFSTGLFHARYVPVDRIVWGAHACASAGLNVVINIESFQESGFDAEGLAQHPLLDEFRRTFKIQVNQSSWMPNGGEIQGCASEGRTTTADFALTHDPGKLRFHGDQNKTACVSSLSVLTINPDQELITCCGLTLEYIPELHVGSIRAQSLKEAIRGIQPDLLKMWIHAEGPEKVLDFVKEKAPDFQLPLDAAHICHTCQYLYANDHAKEVLRAHYREVEDRVLEKYFLTAVSLDMAAKGSCQMV